MTQVALPATAPALGHDKEKCPFCKEPGLKNYNTKYGSLKDEGVLEDNLAANAETLIGTDKKVGAIYPLPGGGDNTSHWAVAEGVFEDVRTAIKAAAHHLIPGDAAMDKVPALEQWTTKDKGGVIKQDIGYSIDGAQNGIFLPRYPDIFGTKHIETVDASGKKKKVEMREYYGRSWSDLKDSEKRDIGYTVMCETNLQIHHTSHGAAYLNDKQNSYDKEAKRACQDVADYAAMKQLQCPDNQQDPVDPPYTLVQRINAESRRLKQQITGNPTYWSSWVTRLANEYTVDLQAEKLRRTIKFGISRMYK